MATSSALIYESILTYSLEQAVNTSALSAPTSRSGWRNGPGVHETIWHWANLPLHFAPAGRTVGRCAGLFDTVGKTIEVLDAKVIQNLSYPGFSLRIAVATQLNQENFERYLWRSSAVSDLRFPQSKRAGGGTLHPARL